MHDAAAAESCPGAPTLRRGRVDFTDLPIPPETRVYLCGPLPFMLGIRDALLDRNVPADHIHYEVFGPETCATT
ncbi:Flavohemoprotein [Nocardia sp. RB20]|uniref:Flavohemoprotein n=1 Tax=Nocardia macrotermitis TaxID=2585198 RepID=A0A7K0DAN4_9NOCA|nr:Flavohemoprotein [Nocardia macrotermitis]